MCLCPSSKGLYTMSPLMRKPGTKENVSGGGNGMPTYKYLIEHDGELRSDML